MFLLLFYKVTGLFVYKLSVVYVYTGWNAT